MDGIGVKPLNIYQGLKNVKFSNETDKISGLESVISNNFYTVMLNFVKDNTILIPKNRFFCTTGIKNIYDVDITGIKGIPDAILLEYFPDNQDIMLKVHMIEYECNNTRNQRVTERLNHLSAHIVPQIIRFALAFTITTDYKIRNANIKSWTNKIIDYISSDEELVSKVTRWIQNLQPETKITNIISNFEKELEKAFIFNLGVTLVTDEITVEEKKIIESVLNSFKMDNSGVKGSDNVIKLGCYAVKLGKTLNLTTNEETYETILEEI